MASISSASAPQFTESQKMAMSAHFQRQLGTDEICWNEIPSSDPLWERCFTFLIDDYQKYIASSPKYTTVAKEALAFLTHRKKEGNLSAFFSDHVVTTIDQIKGRISLFIRRVHLNQERQYTCFIPSMRSSSIACFILAENKLFPKSADDTYVALSKALKGRVEVIREVDLLLDASFDEKDIPQHRVVKKHRFVEKDVRILCLPVYTLPPSKDGIKQAIEDSIPAPFQAKVDEIGRIQAVKRKVFFLILCSAVAYGAFMIGRNYFKDRFEMISL
jgi:hypothetical protein